MNEIAALNVKNLTKIYGTYTAVDGISFSVPRGSICFAVDRKKVESLMKRYTANHSSPFTHTISAEVK